MGSTLTERYLWLAGAEQPGVEIKTITSPFDGQPVTQVHQGDLALLELAIAQAHETYETRWREVPAHQRAQILTETAALIEREQEQLATVMAQEVGKPIQTARGEVKRAQQTFRDAAHACLELRGEQIPMDIVPNGVGRLALTLRQSLGVVGAITPFNFPLNLVAHKVAPAIAAGNTVVLKPPSDGPSAALILAALLHEAGLPPGVLQVVPCGGAVAERLASHPLVKILTFTGSNEVGWHLRGLAREKKVMLELGSMSPAIIHEDADLELAIARCVFGGYAFAGQVCIHTQRLLIHRPCYEAFLAGYLPQVAALKVGDPLDPETFVGPLIRPTELDRIHHWVTQAQAAGAALLAGGHPHPDYPTCYLPTVLEDVPITTELGCQEVFGPVTVVQPYDTFTEALTLANQAPYPGLNASVFTQDYRRAFQAAHTLKAGAVLINESPTWRVDHMPYGGHGKSGSGREGPRYAIEEMTEPKLVVFKL